MQAWPYKVQPLLVLTCATHKSKAEVISENRNKTIKTKACTTFDILH